MNNFPYCLAGSISAHMLMVIPREWFCQMGTLKSKNNGIQASVTRVAEMVEGTVQTDQVQERKGETRGVMVS